MKTISTFKFLLAVTISMSLSVFTMKAQNVFPATGNVGIGANPSYFPISLGNSLANTKLSLWDGAGLGSYGFGVKDYQLRLHVGSPLARFSFLDAAAGNELVTILGNGQMGIGIATVPTGFRLAVKGSMICEEVRIRLATNWPDYVFAPTYALKSLTDLEQYIQTNNHLPNVPSASDIEKKGGVDLGEMNVKLLEKIEELTLYMIEQNKKIDGLQKKMIVFENDHKK